MWLPLVLYSGTDGSGVGVELLLALVLSSCTDVTGVQTHAYSALKKGQICFKKVAFLL